MEEKIIVKENVEPMKVNIPLTMYVLVFLHMLLTGYIGYKLINIGYTLIALNMGLI